MNLARITYSYLRLRDRHCSELLRAWPRHKESFARESFLPIRIGLRGSKNTDCPFYRGNVLIFGLLGL